MNKKIYFISAAALLIIAATAGFVGYIKHSNTHPSTNDAYLEANIVNISARIPGAISTVNIVNHQKVKKGQLLFTIDPTPYQIAVKHAQAVLQQSENNVAKLSSKINYDQAVIKERAAKLQLAKQTTQRINPLVNQDYQAKSMGDKVEATLKEAKQSYIEAQYQLQEDQQQLGSIKQNASVAQAKSELAQAKLKLSYTKVYALQDGYISKLTLRRGDYISPGKNLFVLIESKQWWVTAFFKEDQIKNIHAQQSAVISLDMYGEPLKGQVESLGYSSGTSFSLLPAENGSGNWVKVTQRFPVRIKITSPTKKVDFRVGASASVMISTVG